MDNLHLANILHGNFPNEILSKKQCESLIVGLKRFPLLMAQIDSVDIVIGWVQIFYRYPKTLQDLQNIISSVEGVTQLHLQILPDNVSSLWILYLAIPSSIAETREETLRIFTTENPDINCKLWKVLCITEEDGFQEYVLSITKSCFIYLNAHSCIVRFKRQSLTGRLDSHVPAITHNREVQLVDSTPCPSKHTKMSPNRHDAEQINDDKDVEKLYRLLVDSGIHVKEAHQRIQVALRNLKMCNKEKWDPKTRNKFNFNFSKNFENLQLIDEILTQPSELSEDRYFILCHNNFPKTFFSKNILNEVRSNLINFLKKMPMNVAIDKIIVEDGWLKIMYGNDSSRNLVALVTHRTKFPLKMITKDKIPSFRFVHLSKPLIKCSEFPLVKALKAENSLLSNTQWFVAQRVCYKKTQEIVTLTMDNSTFKSLKLNSFLVKYRKDSYVLEPDSHELDTDFISNGEMVDEKQKLYLNLCKTGINDNDAIKRTGLAFYKYLQFKVFAIRERMKFTNVDGFFTSRLFSDNYENLILFDEMLTQTVEAADSNNFFLLSHTNFPTQVLQFTSLKFINLKLNDFVSNMSIKSGFSSEICNAGWLKIRIGNEAASKWIKRAFQFMNNRCGNGDKISILLSSEIPKVCFIKIKIPDREVDSKNLLAKLSQENVNLNCESWKIVEEKMNDLTIVIDEKCLKLVYENSFGVNYDGQLQRVWVHENLTNFVWKDEVDGNFVDFFEKNSNEYDEILNNEMKKLEEYLCRLGITPVDAQQRANVALKNYKQFQLLTKSRANKGFSFFTNEVFKNDFENLKIFDALLQSDEANVDNSFILCPKTFPNLFFNNYNLNHIRNKLMEYIKEFPINLAIGDILFEAGWLNVHCGNDATLQWFSNLGLAYTSKTFPWKVLTKHVMPNFGFVKFKLPYEAITLSDESLLLQMFNQRYIAKHSIHIARRDPDHDCEEVIIVMNLSAVYAKKSCLVNFNNKSYEGIPFKMTKKGCKSLKKTLHLDEKDGMQEFDDKRLYVNNAACHVYPDGDMQLPYVEHIAEQYDTSNVTIECEEDERYHLFEQLCALGVGKNDAQQRVEKAINKYKIFKLHLGFKDSSTQLSFFNPDLVNDSFQHSQNLLLFDEMLNEPCKMANDKFFIICPAKFPDVLFTNCILSTISEALFNFLEALPFKHAFGEVRIDDGWLRIYYGNNASLKWMKRVVNFVITQMTKLKLIPSYSFPTFWAVILTIKIEGDVPPNKKFLKLFEEGNSDIDISSWVIARKESKKQQSTLTITMDKESYDSLSKKLFQVKLFSNIHTAQPFETDIPNFAEPDESVFNEIAATNFETADQMANFNDDNKSSTNKETPDLAVQMKNFIDGNKSLINKISNVFNHSDVYGSKDNESLSRDTPSFPENSVEDKEPPFKIIGESSIKKFADPVKISPQVNNFVEFNKSLINSIRQCADMSTTEMYNVSNTINHSPIEIDCSNDSCKSSNDQNQVTANNIPVSTEVKILEENLSIQSEIENNPELKLEQKMQKLKEQLLEIKLEKLKREYDACVKKKKKVSSENGCNSSALNSITPNTGAYSATSENNFSYMNLRNDTETESIVNHNQTSDSNLKSGQQTTNLECKVTDNNFHENMSVAHSTSSLVGQHSLPPNFKNQIPQSATAWDLDKNTFQIVDHELEASPNHKTDEDSSTSRFQMENPKKSRSYSTSSSDDDGSKPSKRNRTRSKSIERDDHSIEVPVVEPVSHLPIGGPLAVDLTPPTDSHLIPWDIQQSSPNFISTHCSQAVASEPWTFPNLYGKQNQPNVGLRPHPSFTEMTPIGKTKDDHDYAVQKFLEQLSTKKSRDRSCEDNRRRRNHRSRSRSRGRRRSNSRSRRRSRSRRSRSRNRRRRYSRENEYRTKIKSSRSRCEARRSKSRSLFKDSTTEEFSFNETGHNIKQNESQVLPSRDPQENIVKETAKDLSIFVVEFQNLIKILKNNIGHKLPEVKNSSEE